jgi:hypothetical protein
MLKNSDDFDVYVELPNLSKYKRTLTSLYMYKKALEIIKHLPKESNDLNRMRTYIQENQII